MNLSESSSKGSQFPQSGEISAGTLGDSGRLLSSSLSVHVSEYEHSPRLVCFMMDFINGGEYEEATIKWYETNKNFRSYVDEEFYQF